MTDKKGKVWLTHFKKPNGNTEEVSCRVPKETEKKAENMILSTEILTTGEVAIYSRFKDEPEEKERLEIATNGPGEKQPDKMLIKLIDRVYDERNN